MDKKEKIELTKEIIKLIGNVGMLAAITIAPGLGKVFKPLLSKNRQKNFNGCVNQALGRLERRGFLRVETRNGMKFVSLTSNGRQIMNKMELAKLKIKKPKKWDNCWRFFIFDVKEKNRVLRDQMRRVLFNLGFRRLQGSVWVYPYKCDSVLELIRSGYNLRREILYFTAVRFPGDYPLIKYFQLS